MTAGFANCHKGKGMSDLHRDDASTLGETVEVEESGFFLVNSLSGRKWAVKGDPIEGWWGEVMPDGSLSDSDWEYWPKEKEIICMLTP